ncbi:MAG: hypothetical protein CMJ47_14430 [Planctomyces sp.]|nr:hypothetical protein [Planctomyces sp.]
MALEVTLAAIGDGLESYFSGHWGWPWELLQRLLAMAFADYQSGQKPVPESPEKQNDPDV